MDMVLNPLIFCIRFYWLYWWLNAKKSPIFGQTFWDQLGTNSLLAGVFVARSPRPQKVCRSKPPSKPRWKTRGLGGLKHFAHERPSLRWELMGAVLAVLFCRIRGMEKGPWKNDVRKISSFGAITSFFITSPLLPVSSPHLLIFFVCCIFDWFVHVR